MVISLFFRSICGRAAEGFRSEFSIRPSEVTHCVYRASAWGLFVATGDLFLCVGMSHLLVSLCWESDTYNYFPSILAPSQLQGTLLNNLDV